jgi:hypothetical protein
MKNRIFSFITILLLVCSLLLLFTCEKLPLNPYDPEGVEKGYVTQVPVFGRSEGTYNKDIEVTLTCPDGEAVIYYTLDGTEPTVDSLLYSAPILVAGDGTHLLINTAAKCQDKILSGTAEASYTISYLSLTIQSSANGTVSPSGAVKTSKDSSINITSSPDVGYAFSHWTVESGTGVIIENIYSLSTSVTLTETGGTVQANFAPGIALTVGNDGNGTTTPNGEVLVVENIPRSISAEPAAVYTFKEWSVVSGSGVVIEETSSMTTNVTLSNGPGTVRANFELVTYQLTVSPSTGGTVTPAAPVEIIHSVAQAITAIPASGYVFTGWSILAGTGVAITDTSDPTTTVILTGGDAEIQANFRILRTLTMSNDGHGTTTPASGNHPIGDGFPQAITATPSSGYGFTHWTASGSASVTDNNNASTAVTLTGGNGSVTANFTDNTYTLTVNSGGNGTTSPSGASEVVHGVATAISATATTANYEFVSWTVTSGTASFGNSNAASTTVALTSGSATIQANFALESYALTMTDNGFGSTSASTTVTYGVAHSITATPDTGYDFDSWSVTSGTVSIADTGSASTTVTLTEGAATLQANFTLKNYTLQINNDGNGSTSPTGSQTVSHAEANAISATPTTAGYEFASWSVTSGSASIADSSSAGTTVTLTNGAATIQANFALKTYTLTMTDNGFGSTSSSTTVTHGVAHTIIATPDTGYEFSGWTIVTGDIILDDASSSSTNAYLTSGDAEVRADFELKNYSLTIANDGGGTTTPSGVVSVNYGVSTAIEAVSLTGRQFNYWSVENGSGVAFGDADDSTTTVTLTDGNAEIRANFILWPQIEKLLASDGSASDYFGWSVSISGDYAVIGAQCDDDNGSQSGSAYIFYNNGTSWSQQAKLMANDAFEYDVFGTSVSISGDYVIIGAYSDDDNGSSSGSAYIFFRDGTSWSQQAKLIAADGAANDRFGQSVSISGDSVVISAILDNGNTEKSGTAYIFTRSGTTWSQQVKLTAADGATDDLFGLSVAISGDYAVIGAAYDDDTGNNSGSAYVYYRDGSLWSQQAKLIANDGAADDLFGSSESISGDYAVIGAYEDDDNGWKSGSAYIFYRTGSTWSQQTKIVSDDGAADDQFGWSVSISGDTAIIGTRWDDDKGSNSGSAYLFNRDETSWSQQAKIVADDGATEDFFGYSVAISGGYAVIGAYEEDYFYSDAGCAYIFGGE